MHAWVRSRKSKNHTKSPLYIYSIKVLSIYKCISTHYTNSFFSSSHYTNIDQCNVWIYVRLGNSRKKAVNKKKQETLHTPTLQQHFIINSMLCHIMFRKTLVECICAVMTFRRCRWEKKDFPMDNIVFVYIMQSADAFFNILILVVHIALHKSTRRLHLKSHKLYIPIVKWKFSYGSRNTYNR